jgi:hypothetical protein
MLDTMDIPSQGNRSNNALNQQHIARLNKALIDLDDERVRQSMQREHKISELNDEYSYIYMLLEEAKAEEKRLKAENSSGKVKARRRH